MSYITRSKNFIISTVFLGSAFTIFLSGIVSPTMLNIWLFILIFFSALRELFASHLHKILFQSKEDKKWLIVYNFLNILIGIIWGLSTYLSIDAGSSFHLTSSCLLLTGVAVYGMLTIGSSRSSSILFFLAVIAPLIFILLIGSKVAHWTLALTTIVISLIIITLYNYKFDLIYRLHVLKNVKHKNKNASELETTNKLFRLIVEGATKSPIIVYEFGQHGRAIYANEAACSHFKMSKESLLKLKGSDYSKTYAAGIPHELAKPLLEGGSITFEDEHLIYTGEYIPVEMTFSSFIENGNRYAVAYFVDIRERISLEKQRIAIKESEAKQQAESHFKRLVEAYPDSIVRINLNGEITYAREDSAAVFGFTPKEMLNKKMSEMNVADNLKPLAKKLTKMSIKTGKENKYHCIEEWIIYKGNRVCVELKNFPERNSQGKATGVMGFSRFVTTSTIQREILHFLAKTDSSNGSLFLDKMLHTLRDLLICDYVTLLQIDTNKPKIWLASLNKLEPEYKTHISSPCNTFYQATLDNSGLYYVNSEDPQFPKDPFLADLKINNVVCTPLLDKNNKIIGYLSLLSKGVTVPKYSLENIIITIENRIVSELESQKLEEVEITRAEQFRVLVENSPDLISRFDSDLNCIYVNPALVKKGYKEEDPDKFHESIHYENQYRKFKLQIKETIRTGKDSTEIHRGLTPLNQPYIVEARVICEYNKENKVTGAIVIARDISDRIELEERLRQQAETDILTELPNRRAFTKKLNQTIKESEENNQRISLLFIDLDRFKEVNDTLGHDIGDELLQQASQRLLDITKKSDLVSRLGGDEFVILLTSEEDSVNSAEIAKSIIQSLSEPYHLNTTTTYVSASIGIANYPIDTDDPKKLIAYADQAMYYAKQHGRNTFCFFTSTMKSEADDRLVLLNDLRTALDEDQLHMVFQPIVDSTTEDIIKAEALIRWIHPEKGFIPPDKFIPLAEETRLINDIGDWVFQKSALFAKKWQQKSKQDIQVSINISPQQFNQENIAEKFLTVLDKMNLPTRHIILELTETLLLGEQNKLQIKLNKFKTAGVGLAIDDFGTGYSAMSYLKKFPIDYLKLDGSFIRDMENDSNDCAIAETITLMSAKLGMKSIAECVETEEQRQMLVSYGCDYIQGYLYSKPLKEEDFFAFLNSDGRKAG